VQHGFYGNISGACQGYLNKNVAGMDGMLAATAVIAAWADMTARIEAACKTIPKRGEASMTLADASDAMEAAKQSAMPRTLHRPTMIQTAEGVVTLPSKSPEPLYALPTA
jgi:hypothetical protein